MNPGLPSAWSISQRNLTERSKSLKTRAGFMPNALAAQVRVALQAGAYCPPTLKHAKHMDRRILRDNRTCLDVANRPAQPGSRDPSAPQRPLKAAEEARAWRYSDHRQG